MATPTISTSFIEEFESGVHMAYQRMGSKLRNTVRTVNGVKNKTTFQKIWKERGQVKEKICSEKLPALKLQFPVGEVHAMID